MANLSKLFLSLILKGTEESGTWGADYRNKVEVPETTTGWTLKNQRGGTKEKIVSGQNLVLKPDWEAPIADYMIFAWISYAVTGIAAQKVQVTQDALAARDERKFFACSFDTTLTIDNATGADVYVDYIIVDPTAYGAF